MSGCCGGKCAAGTDPAFSRFASATKREESGDAVASRYPRPRASRPSELDGTWKEDPKRPQFSAKRTPAANASDTPYTYRGANLAALDFPLGGIGAGHVFLQGDGTLGQFAIVNQVKAETEPTTCMPSCFFGISATTSSASSPANFVLASPETYRVSERRASSSRHAVSRLQQLPGIRGISVRATYPVAEMTYDIDHCPVNVSLEAVSPLVPGDLKNSSLPLAVFTFTVENPSKTDVATVRLLQAQQNFVGWNGHDDCTSGSNASWGGNVNRVARLQASSGSGGGGVLLTNPSLASDAASSGTVAIGSVRVVAEAERRGVTRATKVSSGVSSSPGTDSASAPAVSVIVQAEDEADLWQRFVSRREVPVEKATDSTASEAPSSWAAGVVQTVTIAPGERATVRFALAWHFPNRERDASVGQSYANILPSVLGNYYASTWFRDALDVLAYANDDACLDAIATTRTFVRTAYDETTIPPCLLDSALGRLAVLRSPTMWICADGTVLGTEGNGCCPLNCTHVYGYTTLLERVYPDLAKNMRESDFCRNFDIAKGGCTMRFGTGGWAIDGALACVVKTYLVLRQTGEIDWLRDRVWPNVLAQMRYVVGMADADEVIRGAQQNTYDTAMYGANTFIGSYYVVGLLATAAMARLVGDDATASEFAKRAETAAASYDRICYEADFGYYVADVTEKNCKYSYGPGCFVDQICAAGLALACDFGYLFDEAHERSARKAIAKYNVVTMPPFQDLQKHFFPGDTGITVCAYPNGKLGDGMMYENLVSSGFTSPVIAGLVHDDELEDATRVATAIRRRQDGRNRSPWNEPECNLLYSRAMAHWNLLDQATGFAYDATKDAVRVRPPASIAAWSRGKKRPTTTDAASAFSCLIVLRDGWGKYALSADETSASVTCLYGSLRLRTLEISVKATSATATLGDDADVDVSADGNGGLTFGGAGVTIGRGETLTIRLAGVAEIVSVARRERASSKAAACCGGGKRRAALAISTTTSPLFEGQRELVAVLAVVALAFVVGVLVGRSERDFAAGWV